MRESVDFLSENVKSKELRIMEDREERLGLRFWRGIKRVGEVGLRMWDEYKGL